MLLRSETKVGAFVLLSVIIFAYMAIHLGVFRLYFRSYKPYTLYFNDLNGLEKKSDVKIAGVKVGWVDSVELVENGAKAKVKIMIQDKYSLYSDAHADIHQDGLLGTKCLDLHPGNYENCALQEGDVVGRIVKAKASLEDLMQKFDKIASNIQDVSESLKSAIGNQAQSNDLRAIVENINEASKKIAIFTDTLCRNENNLDKIFYNLKEFSQDIAPVGKDIQRVADVFDHNFSQLSSTLDETMKNINSIAQKIDTGKGLVGKLINENEIYEDLKVVANEFREIANVADKTGIVLDSHFESMGRNAEHYNHPDSKGYFDVRLFTREDLFYMLQIIGTEKGSITRNVAHNKIFDNKGRPVKSEQAAEAFGIPFKLKTLVQTRNTIKFGLQVGKIYKDLALRFGIFENSAGVGIDYEIPFCNENFRWVTTLEAWDFRGQNRINDRRPHLKWLNRVFFCKNIYIDFGADDFISKHNANAFFGFGLRFGDDDIKYLLSKLGFLATYIPS